MPAAPSPIQRLRLHLGALLQEAGLAALVRGTLRPLPEPRRPRPPAGGGLAGLWRALSDLPLDARDESGFTSTARVVKGDAWRKQADQVPELAGRGPLPPGWELVDGEPMGAGRAPLHALLHPPAPGRPIVVVVHGLYDSKQSRYVRLAAEALVGGGCGVVVPDMRWHGCLLSREWLPALGREESLDLLAWARWIGRRHRGHPVGLLGFSLGALAVLHALGSAEAPAVLAAGGIAVSPPAALHRVASALDVAPRFADAGLDVFVLDLFQRFLRLRMAALGIAGDAARPFTRFLGWLAEQPALAGPGVDGDRLLDLGEPAAPLAACRCPCLLLSARNDPVFGEGAAVQLALEAQGNPYVHLLETPGGGHIGQLGTYPQWMAEVLRLFFGTTPGL